MVPQHSRLSFVQLQASFELCLELLCKDFLFETSLRDYSSVSLNIWDTV